MPRSSKAELFTPMIVVSQNKRKLKMICNKCQHELFSCECPDIDDRINDLENNPSTYIMARQVRRERIVYKLGVMEGKHMASKEKGSSK
jgi:hypothetical protein